MDISLILKALGDPTRLSIYQQLLTRKHCVRSLSKKMNVSESAISQHMKILREADLVCGERFGYHIHYIPNPEALEFMRTQFAEMKDRAVQLSTEPKVCNCEFRETEQTEQHE